jgi:hypothetical protein
MLIMSKRAKRTTTSDKSKDRGPVLYLRLTPEHEEAIQRFIAAQRIRPDRTTVGITAIEELLAREGFWPLPVNP